ncbi:MAG: hypothetical protein HYU64_09295 [Armatimonadetes bacterium]|nr:hypothetical protein [Armatimonadota bacterium]
MRKLGLVCLLIASFLVSGCAGGGGGGGLSSSGSAASGLGPAGDLSNSLRLTVSWRQGKALPASATAILVNVVDMTQWSPEQGRPEIVAPNAIKAKAQAARQGDIQTIVVTGVPTGLFWIDVTALDSSGNRVAAAYTVMRLTDAGAELTMEDFRNIFWASPTVVHRHSDWAGGPDGRPQDFLRIEAGYSDSGYKLVAPPPGVGIQAYLNGSSLGSLSGPNLLPDAFGRPEVPMYFLEPLGLSGGVYEIAPFGPIPSDYGATSARVALEDLAGIAPTTFVFVTDGVNSHPSALDSTKPIAAAWNPVPGAVEYYLAAAGGGSSNSAGPGGPSFYWRSPKVSGTSTTIPPGVLPAGAPGISLWVEARRFGAESHSQRLQLTLGGGVSVTVNRDSQGK